MADDDLIGGARGSETLLDAPDALARDGFTGQFMARSPDASTQAGRIECASWTVEDAVALLGPDQPAEDVN